MGSQLVGGIHHAALTVRDLDEATERWTRLLGLHGGRAGTDLAVLRCAFEDCAIVLRQSSAKPFLDYVCYELVGGVTLDQAHEILAGRGAGVSSMELPSRGPALGLEDPDGNRVVLVERVIPADRRTDEARLATDIPAWHPRKIGHVNFLTRDVHRQVAWYTTMLGFAVTDWIGTEGVWLHVNRDHHVLAFLEKDIDHIHHIAFELIDWGELRVALDHLGRNGRPLVWGPGRHGMARNLYSYFRMVEEELFIELFCDLEQLERDHEPRVYPDDPHSSNVWGILPPRTYFRFDAAAIAAEQEQSYAYDKPIQAAP